MKRATFLLFLLILTALICNAQGYPPYNITGRITCVPSSCTSNEYAPAGTYLTNYETMNASCYYGEYLNIVPGSYVYNCVFPTALIASSYAGFLQYYENGNFVQAGALFGSAYTYDIIGGQYQQIWQMSVVADCFNDNPRYYKQDPAGC